MARVADGSPIEWLQRPGTRPATWNPIRALDKATGKRGWFCVHVHEGCRFCYAEKQNINPGDSGGNGHEYKAQNIDKVDIILHEPTLLQPLKWREPRTIFVCSMTDLYGDWVKDEWLDRIKAVQAITPQHTYIELTKRPERMRACLESIKPAAGRPWDRITDIAMDIGHCVRGYRGSGGLCARPLPNVWGLVSCSTQEDADKYIPILLQTPLAVRGVSLEPLLGPIDLRRYLTGHEDNGVDLSREVGSKVGACVGWTPPLDWVIVGGESGKGARPMHPDWARSLRDQCKAAGVAFFFKQWGEWWDAAQAGPSEFSGTLHEDDRMVRVGKKIAGRRLDGQEHNEFPACRAGGL